MPTSPKILLLEADSMSSRIVAMLSPRNAARLIERGQARLDHNGDLRVTAPNRALEHPARTRISSGGLLAAIGMSQIYTMEARPKARYKRIFPEDRGCFNLATNPGSWLVAISIQLSALSSALSALV